MSVIITKEDLRAYSEVNYVINHMNERYVAKIPDKLITFFETIRDPNYEIYIDPHKPLEKQGLSKYALEILALLHVKYWCANKERKEELLEKMKANEEKFEAKLREQFNTDNLFKNNTNTQVEEEEDPLVTAYSKYTTQNPDIQDYTDLRKDNTIQEDKLPEKLEEKTTIFSKLKSFVAKIFGKSTN